MLAILLALAGSTVFAQNTDVEDTREVYPSETIVDGELRILSYNIKMLPRLIARVRYGPIKRSRLIPAHLIDDQIDIIVFQEAFDVRARRILKRRLKKEYPYIVGPANKPGIPFVTNSGVMMFSKVPIEKLGRVRYEQAEGIDRMARKGALLVQGEWNGQPFQLLGTHLQAGGSRETKISQYEQIAELIKEHEKQGVPQILVGDYNTHQEDTSADALYPILLEKLQAQNGPLYGDRQYSAGNDNDMRGKSKNSLIDFCLYKANGVKTHSIVRHIRSYRQRWHEKYRDLSDHFAVLMRIQFTRVSEGEPMGE